MGNWIVEKSLSGKLVYRRADMLDGSICTRPPAMIDCGRFEERRLSNSIGYRRSNLNNESMLPYISSLSQFAIQ